MALALILWISFGLSTLALYFAHDMVMEYRAAANSVAAMEADQIAEGARRYVINFLRNLEEPGRLPKREDLEYEYEQVPVGNGYFWLLGRADPGKTDNAYPAFGLMDEAAKININTAPREMLERLFMGGVHQSAVLSEIPLDGEIIDWRDEDTEPVEEGAELDSYLRLQPAYLSKDGPFETVSELRLLYSMEPEMMRGEDDNLNGWLDDAEDDGAESEPEDNRDGRLDAGLLEFCTIYSNESNTRADGTPRLNVSDNEQGDQIRELLTEALDESRAGEIMGAAGIGSNQFTSLIDFYIRSGMDATEFSLVADDLTTTDTDYLPGLINVNLASEAVLACVPGIGEEFASTLVSYRQDRNEELKTVAWVVDVLGEEAARQAGPYLTTRTYQVGADIVAVGSNGRAFKRIFYVLDISGDEPLVVFRQDRTDRGWPLGPEIRRELTEMVESGESERYW